MQFSGNIVIRAVLPSNSGIFYARENRYTPAIWPPFVVRFMSSIPWLHDHIHDFPSPALALDNPNGLLAAGGDLSPARILAAYRQGIFPWFNPGEPILWWSPSPRTVIYPEQLHISRSLRKTLRQGHYRVTLDTAFTQVMEACAQPRADESGTWISPAIIAAYTQLHRQGFAHSVEVWRGDELVGGLYGIALGRMFFGESMFSRADNASKVGFAHLVQQLMAWDFPLIDCQVANDHLFSLGAVEIPRESFQQMLLDFTQRPALPGPWKLAPVDWT
jgi:leucyl/phenylalanyl-tRNA--protein transferase